MYLQCSHGFLGQYFSGWCFTLQYKNSVQFCVYTDPGVSQNTNTSKADHTHDNRYYQLTAISVQDCLQDTCAPGTYIFDRTALNKPTSDTTLGGIVLTIGYSVIYCCRLAITTDGCFYTSVLQAGISYGTWKQI